jgi:hypothetical protein
VSRALARALLLAQSERLTEDAGSPPLGRQRAHDRTRAALPKVVEALVPEVAMPDVNASVPLYCAIRVSVAKLLRDPNVVEGVCHSAA